LAERKKEGKTHVESKTLLTGTGLLMEGVEKSEIKSAGISAYPETNFLICAIAYCVIAKGRFQAEERIVKINPFFAGLVACLGLSIPLTLMAQDMGEPDVKEIEKSFPSKPPYSPYAGRDFPTRVFWGDTHLHTSFSMDAGAFGARLTPRDAYIFAKGNEVTASSGQRVKLGRPLDFLVVTDHSDGMGFFPLLFGGDPKILVDPQGKKWYGRT
jgi:hypothetical protein